MKAMELSNKLTGDFDQINNIYLLDPDNRELSFTANLAEVIVLNNLIILGFDDEIEDNEICQVEELIEILNSNPNKYVVTYGKSGGLEIITDVNHVEFEEIDEETIHPYDLILTSLTLEDNKSLLHREYDSCQTVLKDRFDKLIWSRGFNSWASSVGDNFDSICFNKIDDKGKRVFGTTVAVYYKVKFIDKQRVLEFSTGTCGSFPLSDIGQVEKYRILTTLFDLSDKLEQILICGIEDLVRLRHKYNELDELEVEFKKADEFNK